MKPSLGLAAAFSMSIVLVVAGFGIARLSQGPGTAPPPIDPGALARFEDRLRGAEERLAELPRIEAEIARLRGVQLAPLDASPDPDPAPETAEGEEREAAADSLAGKRAAPAGKLERWLEAQGMREEMEQFVAKVYEQSRNTRRQREQEEAEARQREAEELSKGPYGKHNYRVNSLAKKLDLDPRQKDFLFNLLTRYEERGREARTQLVLPEGKEPTQEELQHHMKQVVQVKQDLNQQFEGEFLLGLGPEQQEAYKGLPEDERGLGGNVRMAFADGVKIFAAGGEAMVEQAARFIEKVAAPPAQPGAPK